MSVLAKELAQAVILAWRDRLREMTLVEAVILLKHLGSYHHDKITVLYKGYVRVKVIDLLGCFRYYEPCVNLRPVYFEGGPYNRHYKGTFLTVVTDRVLLAAEEHGTEFVIKAIDYAKSYGPANR